jgi:CHASE1-domain containing sensor protein
MGEDRVKSKKKFLWKRIVLLIVLLVAVLGIAGTAYFYNKYQQIKKDPTTVATQETTALVQTIGKLMVLPTGETPTVATVTDKTKLTSQVFFKDAQNGDKLLAYTIAKKAILYRPSSNKIINIAPFNISSTNDN